MSMLFEHEFHNSSQDIMVLLIMVFVILIFLKVPMASISLTFSLFWIYKIIILFLVFFLCFLQLTMELNYYVETVPRSGTASTAAATNMFLHAWPGLMQSSTVCHREPTWHLSTVWRNISLWKSWSVTLTPLKDTPGLDSQISIKKEAGCGLMVVQWISPIGLQISQTTWEEMNTVFIKTLVWSGMTIDVLKVFPLSVQLAVLSNRDSYILKN